MNRIAIHTPTDKDFTAICKAVGYDIAQLSYFTFASETVIYMDCMQYGTRAGATQRGYETINADLFLSLTDRERYALLTGEKTPTMANKDDDPILTWFMHRTGLTREWSMIVLTLIMLTLVGLFNWSVWIIAHLTYIPKQP